MNQKQMAQALAAACGCTVSLAESLLIAQIEIIVGALQNGDEVGMGRMGSFFVSENPERMARNPRTEEPVIIPARKTMRFRINKKIQGRIR